MQGNLKSNTSMDKQIPTDVAFNTVLVNVYGIRFRFSKCTSQKEKIHFILCERNRSVFQTK